MSYKYRDNKVAEIATKGQVRDGLVNLIISLMSLLYMDTGNSEWSSRKKHGLRPD